MAGGIPESPMHVPFVDSQGHPQQTGEIRSRYPQSMHHQGRPAFVDQSLPMFVRPKLEHVPYGTPQLAQGDEESPMHIPYVDSRGRPMEFHHHVTRHPTHSMNHAHSGDHYPIPKNYSEGERAAMQDDDRAPFLSPMLPRVASPSQESTHNVDMTAEPQLVHSHVPGESSQASEERSESGEGDMAEMQPLNEDPNAHPFGQEEQSSDLTTDTRQGEPNASQIAIEKPASEPAAAPGMQSTIASTKAIAKSPRRFCQTSCTASRARQSFG